MLNLFFFFGKLELFWGVQKLGNYKNVVRLSYRRTLMYKRKTPSGVIRKRIGFPGGFLSLCSSEKRLLRLRCKELLLTLQTQVKG